MTLLQTERLQLRELVADDDAFILQLLNEPSFLANIGDRGVHDLESARRYIDNGPRTSYAVHGFGLWLVQRKEDGAAIGLCGLLRRDTLPHADIGYALLPRYWSHGYAIEACTAVRDHALRTLALPRLLAIVSPGNAASVKVLERIGLSYQGMVEIGTGPLQLFALDG